MSENCDKKHYSAAELAPMLGTRAQVVTKNKYEGKKGTIISVRLTESGQYKKPIYFQFDSVAGQSEVTDFDVSDLKSLTTAHKYGYVDATGTISLLSIELPTDRATGMGLARASQYDESKEV
jgi:hypothetical protein